MSKCKGRKDYGRPEHLRCQLSATHEEEHVDGMNRWFNDEEGAYYEDDNGFDNRCHGVYIVTGDHCTREYCHTGKCVNGVFSWTDSSCTFNCDHPYLYPGYRNPKFEKTAVANGNRVQFEGGGMRDSQNGKPRFDLLLPEGTPFEELFLTRIARLMARGAEHYEDRNWEQFADKAAYDRARSSALRHMMQWLAGETDEDHAASVYFNLMAAEHIKRKMEE